MRAEAVPFEERAVPRADVIHSVVLVGGGHCPEDVGEGGLEDMEEEPSDRDEKSWWKRTPAEESTMGDLVVILVNRPPDVAWKHVPEKRLVLPQTGTNTVPRTGTRADVEAGTAELLLKDNDLDAPFFGGLARQALEPFDCRRNGRIEDLEKARAEGETGGSGSSLEESSSREMSSEERILILESRGAEAEPGETEDQRKDSGSGSHRVIR